MDLAMRGKLVPQDPNDEPASVLLEKIKAEKAELIKEKKIKKTKPLPPITDDEKPFDIPDSWEWVRLGDAFEITSSKRVMKKEWRDTGIPFYRAREIVSIKENRPLKDPIFIDEKTYADKLKVSGKPEVNDILLTGVGTLGVPYIVPKDKKFYFKDGNIIWLKNFAQINASYISYYVQSPYMIKKINNGRGTTVATLTIVRSNNLLVPLPPLLEQSRIAAKIAQLFALLRKVETSTQQYAKLQTLLKSKVLDLAMRGKLVKQDPNDEPASVLLEKIKAEKQELIKEKKIKKTKPLPPITDDEKPFDIPDSWEWVRCQSVTTGNFKSITPDKIKIGENLIELADIESYSGKLINVEKITEKVGSNKYQYVKGDVLFAKLRPYLKKVVLAPNNGVCTTELLPIDGININNNFLYYVFTSDSFFNQIKKEMHGVNLPRVSPKKLSELIIPLPPLLEQNRIVANLNNVCAIIDKNI
nr:restriction endonuclease subunit S [Lactobacillus helveticus]